VVRELITAEGLVRYLREHGGDALFDKKVITFVKSN
jgi:O-methyltransferase involved in polyketide biosynthesis